MLLEQSLEEEPSTALVAAGKNFITRATYERFPSLRESNPRQTYITYDILLNEFPKIWNLLLPISFLLSLQIKSWKDIPILFNFLKGEFSRPSIFIKIKDMVHNGS